MTRPKRRPAAIIFAWPTVIATATIVGLAAGLVGDSGWNMAAWAGLAVPIIAARARHT